MFDEKRKITIIIQFLKVTPELSPLCQKVTLRDKRWYFYIFLEISILEADYTFVLWSKYVVMFPSLEKNINAIFKKHGNFIGKQGSMKILKSVTFWHKTQNTSYYTILKGDTWCVNFVSKVTLRAKRWHLYIFFEISILEVDYIILFYEVNILIFFVHLKEKY